MKIAITGANGFLGGYIVKEFLSRGYDVIALVRKSANCEMLPDHESLSIECVNYTENLTTQFDKLKEKYGTLTYFIHNAGVTVSLVNEEYFKINVGLTAQVLSALEKTNWLPKSSKLLYVSSMAAQGPFGADEPVSNYGRSKLAAEQEVINSGFNYLIFRPTGIYGAGDVAFLPLFKLAVKGIYPLTSDKQKVSMIHAKDLAKIIAVEAPTKQGILHTNDGNTYLHSDFILALKAATGKNIIKIPTPAWISKISLGLSDIWHRMLNKRPGLTLEKFQEISMDWHLHENSALPFSDVPCEITLEQGFINAYDFYKHKKWL